MTKGKLIKRILALYPSDNIDTSIQQFFDFYYTECGLSTSEIIKYILHGTTHSSFVHIAKRANITLEGKGGNVHKYIKKLSCECGDTDSLELLVKNKEKHNNLKLKCNRCVIGELK